MDSHRLGDHVVSKEKFRDVEKALTALKSPLFLSLSDQKKSDRISALLLEFIRQAPSPCFLLPAVVDFIEEVIRQQLIEHYTFSHFELWLNQFSDLSFEENFSMRAKIIGKKIPRQAYQTLFPLGMGKLFSGSHFVTAHSSPDLDTTVASFWGWVDAFGARVSEGLHLWNVPGGPPSSQVEIGLLFYQTFGENVISALAKTRSSLSITGWDLVTQKGVLKKLPEQSSLELDVEKAHQAVILVDHEGVYLGEWRNSDIEKVRFVLNLLNQCLRWYENYLHVKLISLFAKEELKQQDLLDFIKAILGMKIQECGPVYEFSSQQRALLQTYLAKVLGVRKGLESTFLEFAEAMHSLSLGEFKQFADELIHFDKAGIFASEGGLLENRPKIFNFLAHVIQDLDQAIYKIRIYVDRLEVAVKVKSAVLNLSPQHVNYRADLEEIRSKMNGYPYVTVTATEDDGKLSPLGVIYAADVYKQVLGSVSLRDFCNREETKIPPYLEVISVVDHHKSALTTQEPSMICSGDVQSANTLVARLSFLINDAYGTGGMTLKEIEAQLNEVQTSIRSTESKRILQRLLQKALAAEQGGDFFISPEREYTEYLHFLYAILDDTDLLSKISPVDAECVVSLLNRLKSLTLKKEVEVIHLEDIPRDRAFAKKAAKKILQNEEMYSLYRKIYLAKEEGVQENLKKCLEGKSSTFFADTKEQNGCCRVGQTKLFARNWPLFEKHADELRAVWLQEAEAVFKEKKEVDLHLQMMSTIPGAEELYAGTEGKYAHRDEIWIWIPQTESAIEHLKSFLNGFGSAPEVMASQMEGEFCGAHAKELSQIFAESFTLNVQKITPRKLSLAILRFNAGALNSRKAMVSPHLPTVVYTKTT